MNTCPEHHDLMHEMACGRLEDDQAIRAEAVREECSRCAALWGETFGGAAYDRVDEAVAKAVATFSPPVRRRYGWLPVAAALVLAIGVGSTSMLWRGGQPGTSGAGDVVSSLDFESGSLGEAVEAANQTPGDGNGAPAGAAVFVSDLESGDLSSWSSSS